MEKIIKKQYLVVKKLFLKTDLEFFTHQIFWCTGSWGILAWGEGQLGEVPVGGSASWGKCQLGDKI